MSETEVRRRDDIVAVLRRAGLNDLADEVALRLPESVSVDEATQFFGARGVSLGVLTDMMGGSP
jgi:hypothetical protein